MGLEPESFSWKSSDGVTYEFVIVDYGFGSDDSVERVKPKVLKVSECVDLIDNILNNI